MNKKSAIISRRCMLEGGVAAAGTLLAAKSSGQGRSQARVLALIGDRYHNPDYIRVGLDKVFQPLGLKVDYTIQYDSLSRDLLKNYQLLLILRDGMIWPDAIWGPMPTSIRRRF